MPYHHTIPYCNDRISSVNDYPASLSQHVTRPLLKQFAVGADRCGRSFVSLRIYRNPLSRTDVTLVAAVNMAEFPGKNVPLADSGVEFGSHGRADSPAAPSMATTRVATRDAFVGPQSSTPLETGADQHYLKDIAASMASIQTMCRQQAEHFATRLDESSRIQQAELAVVAEQLSAALERQQSQHEEETQALRAEIRALKGTATHAPSAQSPRPTMARTDELADHLDQLQTMAEAIRGPKLPPVAGGRRELKPSSFDGENWEDYKAQFDLIAELNGWSEEFQAIHLAASLKGSAQAVLGDLNAQSRRHWPTLVAALSSRFGAEHQTELHRTQLKTLMRRKDQTLPELAQRTRRLTRQAYPEATEATRETLARDHFIDALPDPDVRWQIQQSRPKSLQDAVTTAIELEAFQLANAQRGVPTRAVVPAPHDVASPSSPGAPPSTLERKLDDLAELLQALVSSSQPRRPAGHQRPAARCWRCGKTGHLQRDCTETGSQNQGNDRQPDSGAGARLHQH